MAEPAKTSPTENINLRASIDQKALIDRAALRLGKTRAEFMLDSAREAAENVLLDQRLFLLDDETLKAFESMLNAPAEPSEALIKTLSAPARWRDNAAP